MSLVHGFVFAFIVLCQHVFVEVSGAESAEDEEQQLLLSHEESPPIIAAFTWPQGTIPFYIDSKTYDEIIADRIRLAMRIIEGVSCVVFEEMEMDVPQPGPWLNITNPNNLRECVHHTLLGDGGQAIMTIGYDCMQRRDIIHALMHVLGFNDEVTHPQRDTFIRILWQNIQPQYRPLFRVRMHEGPLKTMVEYDTMSVMHFHDRAYSINGGATIAPKISGLIINPSEKLSQLDIMKLRLGFGHECKKRKLGNLFETCQNALKDSPGSSASQEGDISAGNFAEVIPLDKSEQPSSAKLSD